MCGVCWGGLKYSMGVVYTCVRVRGGRREGGGKEEGGLIGGGIKGGRGVREWEGGGKETEGGGKILVGRESVGERRG